MLLHAKSRAAYVAVEPSTTLPPAGMSAMPAFSLIIVAF